MSSNIDNSGTSDREGQAPTPGGQAGGPGPAVPIDDFVVHSQRVPVSPKPQRKSSSGGTAVLVLAGIVAVGGIAFAAGRLTAPTAAAATTNGTTGSSGTGANGTTGTNRNGFVFGNGGTGGTGGGGLGAGLNGLAGATSVMIAGTVSAIGNGTLTLTLPSGSTIQILTGTSTTYHAQAAATSSDVKVGSKVEIQTAGGGGGRFFGGAGAPGASPSPGASGETTLNTARTAKDITIVQ